MPPEEGAAATPSGARIGPAADVFALALSLSEALAGRLLEALPRPHPASGRRRRGARRRARSRAGRSAAGGRARGRARCPRRRVGARARRLTDLWLPTGVWCRSSRRDRVCLDGLGGRRRRPRPDIDLRPVVAECSLVVPTVSSLQLWGRALLPSRQHGVVVGAKGGGGGGGGGKKKRRPYGASALSV